MSSVIIPIAGFTRSGGGRVLSKLADYLVDRGVKTIFVVPSNYSIPYYPTKADILAVHSVGRKWKSFATIYNLFSVWRATRKMQPACVIANHYVTAFIVLFLSSKFNKYYYIQAYEVKLAKSYVGKLLAFSTYWFPFGRIVNSPYILPKYFPSGLGVVPAGVDLELYRSHSAPYSTKGVIVLGCVGRVELYKGTREIISAFERLADRYNVFLNVAVHMPDIPSGLKSRVNFFPIENDKELSDFYSKCDVIVATGLVENKAFHYPCAEGMAAGKIVISNYGPLAVKEEIPNPRLVLSNVDVESLEGAVEYALNMTPDQQSLEIEGNLAAVDSYSWEKVGEGFFNIISKAL